MKAKYDDLKRRGLFGESDPGMPFATRGTQQAAPAPGPQGAPTQFPQPPQPAIDALRRGMGTAEQFDEIFGPGAAQRALR